MVDAPQAGRVTAAPAFAPLHRLALSLSATLAVLWSLALTPAGDWLFAPVNAWTAWATAATSAAVGLPLVREGTVLLHDSGFACYVSFNCTAVIPVALLAAAIVPWPAAPRSRLIGIAAGGVLLVLVNQFRLAHLAWLGAYQPAYFDVAHGWLWPALLAVVTIGFWFVWLGFARNNRA